MIAPVSQTPALTFVPIRAIVRLALAMAGGLFIAGLAPSPAARSAPLPVDITSVTVKGGHGRAAGSTFTMVAISWDGGGDVAGRLRISNDGATWGEWQDIEGEADDKPDRGATEDTGRRSLGPIWTGPGRHVEVEWKGPDVAGVALVDTRGSRASTKEKLGALWRGMRNPPQAWAAATAPTVLTR